MEQPRIMELLDNVGWLQQDDQRAYNSQVFKWMVEVSNQLVETDAELTNLTAISERLLALVEDLTMKVKRLEEGMKTKADQY